MSEVSTNPASMNRPRLGRPLACVLTIGFLVYLEFGISRVGTAILIVGGNHPAIQLGMAMALYSIAPVLLAVHAGAATSHLGPRRMLAAGSGVLLCGAALQACPPYVLLFPGALLSGIGFTVLQISLQMHVGESCRPDARVRHFGYFSMVQSAATSLAAMLVGYLSGTRGFHTPLRLTAGVAAVLLALVVLSRRLFRSSPAAAAAQREGSRQGSFIRLVRQRDVRTVLVAGALLAMAWDLHAFIVPFVSRTVKLSPQQIGIVLGLFSGATFVIRVCLPGLIRLVSSVGVIRAALIVVGLCFAAYPWRTSFATMSALAVFLGLALGTAQPNLLALVHDVVAERDVGRVIGLRTILLNFGSSLWPLCFGALGQPVVGFVLPGAGMILLLAGVRFSLTRAKH